MDYRLIETKTEEEFVHEATLFLAHQITEAINEHGICIMGLSGGSTPRAIYHALAKELGIDWANVWMFLVDERYVPSDDKDSNQKLIRDAFHHDSVMKEDHFMFPDTSLPMDACVESYELDLLKLFEKGPLEIMTLGLGEDGHIASLFPPLSDEAFGEKLVIQTHTDRFAVPDRISVTTRVLEQARSHVFLLKGEGKKKVWAEMLASAEEEKRWPAKAVLELGRSTVVTMF